MRTPRVTGSIALAFALYVAAVLGAQGRANIAPAAPPPAAPTGQLSAQDQAGVSLCANCHLTMTIPQSRFHIVDWQRSVHARRGVNCEACHGGDAKTPDMMRAHLNVIPSADPASPVHPARQPATCGKCHSRVLDFYKRSGHTKVLAAQASVEVPTCGSCHNAAAAELLDADQVKARCEQCHAVGRPAGHPEYPGVARIGAMQYSAVERMLDAAREFISLVPDPVARAGFDSDEARARASILSVAEASHSLDYDTIDEKITVAFDRVVALVRRVIAAVTTR